ncbi:hypothetical protein [Clostridium sp.]|uniref:hypothetical protein n=1 Tax=Clostridium sp. TaxID=1506 RepID=UPI003D6D8F6F
MEENLDYVCPAPTPQQLLSEECIIASKVYGKCRQQDCLRPDFLEPEPGVDSIPIQASRSGETADIISIGGTVLTTPIAPNGLLILPQSLVKYGKIIDNSVIVSEIQIPPPDEEQTLFTSDGYWKITIRYQFTYRLQLIGYDGTPLVIGLSTDPPGPIPTKDFICAYSEYEKQIILFGGIGSPNVYLASTLFANNGPYAYQNAPYVNVQAKASPLAVSIGTYVDPCVEQFPCPDNIIGVTIGLFTIIKLFRLVNLTVLTSGNCDIPLCDPILPGDPCSFFNEIPFPFDDFDPPTV